ncbi:hypothetical protein JHK85_050292 [Glycine max]|nr:hypothetical protein JHK85_050292 [Glycine max]
MGNIPSTKPMIEVYNWSSAEFTKECAFIYTSITDTDKRSIFRLSLNPEKRMLLRFAHSFCDAHPVRSLHMEATAERDSNGCFNFGVVRVVADGFTSEQTLRDTEHFAHLCGTKSCFYGVVRKGGNVNVGSEEKMTTWEVLLSIKVSLTTHIRYYVNVECDKVRGLRAKFRGPFKCKGQVLREGLPKQSEGSSLIRREVDGKPPKACCAFVESEFTGQEYILFQQQGEGKGTRVNIVNTGGLFHGHEFALIYPKDKSKYSIFHLSINLERVLLRLANALCDDYLVQLLHMEVTGESDNNGSFNLGLVRVVADGITPEQTVRDTEHFDHLCGTKSCLYAVM